MSRFQDLSSAIFKGTSPDVAKSLYDKLQKAGIKSPMVNSVKNQIEPYLQQSTYETRQPIQLYSSRQGNIPTSPIVVPERQPTDTLTKLSDYSNKFLSGAAAVLSFPFMALTGVEKAISSAPTVAYNLWKGDTKKALEAYQAAPTIGGVIKEGFQAAADLTNLDLKTKVGYQYASELIGDLSDVGVAVVLLTGLGNKIATKDINIKITPEEFSGKVPVRDATKRMVIDRMTNNIENYSKNPANAGKIDQVNHIVNEIKTKGIEVKGRVPGNVFRQIVGEQYLGGSSDIKGEIKIPGFQKYSSKTKISEGVRQPMREEDIRQAQLPERQIQQIEGAPMTPQLPVGRSISSIVPEAINVSFQMLDPAQIKAAKTLQTKLQTQLDKKQRLLQTNKATDPSIQKIQSVIQTLQSSLNQAKQGRVIATGPEIQAEEPKTPQIVRTTPEAPKTISTPTRTAVSEPLYHGSYEGKFKIDKNGNINLSPNKNEVTQHGGETGKILTIPTDNLKVKEFRTKTELFNAVQNKQNYSQYDILKAENHAIAIHPNKLARQLGVETTNFWKQKIGNVQLTKIQEKKGVNIVPEKKILPTKEEQFNKTLEELSKERRIVHKAKPIEETPWRKAKISKTEWEALEARKKVHKEERKVKTYAERVAARTAELKARDKQLVEQAKIRIQEARAKKEREGVSAEQLLREEKLMKGLQQFEDQTGRVINNQKADRLSKMEIEIQSLNKQLQDAKKTGRDETYFHDLNVKLYSEFLEGKSAIDKSSIVDQFIDDNFGVGKPEKYSSELLASRVFFLPSEIANGIDSVWQKIIGDKAYDGFKWFMNKLSEIKFTTPSSKAPGVKVHYPFEYLFGTKLENLRPYNRQLQRGMAMAKSSVLDIANDLAKLSQDEQSIVIKKIETMDYSNDKLGQIAKDLESKFVEVGYDLVKRGLMKESTFREYLGKYFPRMYEAFDESNKIAFNILKKRLSNQSYLKLKKDAYGVIYRDGRQKIVKKFETKDERDAFIKDELKPKNKVYETFAPIKQDKIEELKRIEKLPYVVTSRLLQEMNDVVTYDYLNAISQDKNLVSETQDIGKGFVNMAPKTPAYGPLGGKYIHEWYYENVRDLVELPTTIDRGLRLFNGLVKGMKTILDPAVGMANAISNLFLADMAGVPIERVDYWARNLYNSLKNKGAYKVLQSEGVTKQTYAIEEIENFMKIDRNNEELKSLLYNDSKLSTFDLVSTLYSFVKKGWIKAGDLYSFSEDWAKSVSFDWATNELGMDREKAIQFANDAIFNYTEVSRGLRTLRRSFAGAAFPTFAAKIIGAGVKAQIRKPFTVAKWHYILGSLAAMSLAYYGITKDDIKRLKPDSVNSWFIITNVTRDAKGNIDDIQLTDLSRYLPWGQITTMPLGIDSPTDLMFHPELITRTQRGQLNILAGQNILSAFMPGQLILKPIYELMLNHSSFTDKEIYPNDATPVEKFFAIEDYLITSWFPSWTPPSVPQGKGGYLYQKLYSAFTQIPDFQGRVTPISEALLRVVGTKISHVRPGDEFSFLISDIKNDIKTYRSKLSSEDSRYQAAIQNRSATASSKNQAKIRYDEKTRIIEQKLQSLIQEYQVTSEAQSIFEKNTRKKQ